MKCENQFETHEIYLKLRQHLDHRYTYFDDDFIKEILKNIKSLEPRNIFYFQDFLRYRYIEENFSRLKSEIPFLQKISRELATHTEQLKPSLTRLYLVNLCEFMEAHPHIGDYEGKKDKLTTSVDN